MDHKISLYADDIVFISDLESATPHLLHLLKSFGDVSGYSINWQKSDFTPLSTNLSPRFLSTLPFKLTTDYVKYLGIKISRKPDNLFKSNFQVMLDKLKENIEKWRTLPLSLVGRVNTIKMVSLSRFLYLFQNIPIFIPKSFFKAIDSIIMPFIWGYKSHRISKAHLQKPTDLGGLGLPCFIHYYWAANMRALTYWQYGYQSSDNSNAPPWLMIEKQLISNTSLPAILFAAPRRPGLYERPFHNIQHPEDLEPNQSCMQTLRSIHTRTNLA